MHKFETRNFTKRNKNFNRNNAWRSEDNLEFASVQKSAIAVESENGRIWSINKIFIKPNDENNCRNLEWSYRNKLFLWACVNYMLNDIFGDSGWILEANMDDLYWGA